MSAKPSEQRSNRLVVYAALAALLALGAWLRLRFIHTVNLYPDEFVTLLAVQMIGEKGLPVMPSGLFYEHGLLFSYAGSLAAFFGRADLAVRYASLLFGLLTVGLTFYVGQRWFSPAVGLVAATGLTVAPTAIQWSGRARMYGMLQLLVLLALWLAGEGLIRRRAGWRWLALLVYLGAVLSNFVAVTLAPPLVLAVIIFEAGRVLAKGTEKADQKQRPARLLKSLIFERGFRSGQRWREAVALLAILVIAFLVKRAGQPRGIEAMETANALPGLARVFAIYSDFSFNLLDGWQDFGPFYLGIPAVIFAPFALIAGASALWLAGRQWGIFNGRRSGRPAAPSSADPPSRQTVLYSLFLSIILFTTTAEMILFVSPERRDDKYLFMLLPVLLLLGGQGMVQIGRQLEYKWLRQQVPTNNQQQAMNQPAAPPSNPPTLQHSNLPTLLSLSLPLLISGLILIAARPAVSTLLANTGDDYEAAFAYVQEQWRPGDKIMTGTPAAAAYYLGHNDFYAVQRRGGYDYRLLTVKGQVVDRWLGSPAIRTENALSQILANHSVWLVLERWGLQREYYDLPFQQQLLAQTRSVPEAQAQGIFVLRSQPGARPLAPEPAHSTQASFANLVQLLGYTLAPEEVAPGQTARLTLYWQALAPLSHDYTVFVHLRRPEGQTVAQADHRPLGNLYPTSLWPPGEIIRESSDLPLPADLAPGTYDLWAGMYLLESGERLPVQDDASGENAVRLGQVVVSGRS